MRLKSTNGMSALMRTVAVATLAFEVQLTAALPMLQPTGLSSSSSSRAWNNNSGGGSNNNSTNASLPQTLGQLGVKDVVSAQNDTAQTIEVVVDPCQATLTSIFDDESVKLKPADTLIKFVENYCVETADIFMPSKSKFISHTFSTYSVFPGVFAVKSQNLITDAVWPL